MSHSVKRPNSKNEQFRMAVPKDIQHVIGKTAWTQSLRTTDATLAAERRGELVAHFKAIIRQSREGVEREGAVIAVQMLDSAFDKLAQRRGSMDAAIADRLTSLAHCVIDSWSEPGEPGTQSYGDREVREPCEEFDPIEAFATDTDRDLFKLRAELIEGTGKADGFVYRDLAAWMLANRMFRPAFFAISYLSSVEPRLKLADQTFDIVAEAFLRRLSTHVFASWPDGMHQAFAPFSAAEGTHRVDVPIDRAPVQSGDKPAPSVSVGIWSKTLSEAYAYWSEQRRPGRSAKTEYKRGVERFIHLFGDMPVASIGRATVLEFRDLVADIPPQTELAKVVASGATLREHIEAARATRQAWELTRKGDEPPRLSPGTVKKDVGAIAAILNKIHKDAGHGTNVAADIEIAGYSKNRHGQSKPRLPFTAGMMQQLFDSPLYTGCAGQSDAKRKVPGEFIFQDELYWSFLFGVMGGPRLGEISQIALDDIEEIDLRRTFGNEYEGTCLSVRITGTGADQSTKNQASERFVVIHDRLLELGFGDYVQSRRLGGHARLFDIDTSDGSNDKKNLSRRLNKYLDATVTTDRRYVFHSTRHEFTDRANLSKMPSRVSNSIKGHTNKTVGDNYGLVSILLQYVWLKDLKVGFIDWDRLKRSITKGKLLARKESLS